MKAFPTTSPLISTPHNYLDGKGFLEPRLRVWLLITHKSSPIIHNDSFQPLPPRHWQSLCRPFPTHANKHI